MTMMAAMGIRKDLDKLIRSLKLSCIINILGGDELYRYMDKMVGNHNLEGSS